MENKVSIDSTTCTRNNLVNLLLKCYQSAGDWTGLYLHIIKWNYSQIYKFTMCLYKCCYTYRCDSS